jgi:hypothetical protein
MSRPTKTLQLLDLLAPQLPDSLTLDLPPQLMKPNLNVAPLRDALMLPDAPLPTLNAGVACNNEEEVAQILLGMGFAREQESIADEPASIGV